MIATASKRRLAAEALVEHVRRKGKVLISDTTLRDGEQAPGLSFTPQDKLDIAIALERAGVHSIDGGFAASSESDFEAMRLLGGSTGDLVVMSLCRALRGDIDRADQALAGRAGHRRGVSIFLGTSKSHREHKLGKSQEEILAMIRESIGYAAGRFQIVAFAPEDASRTEPEFLSLCYRTAIDAGASSVAFPDTVGILIPELVRQFISRIRADVPELKSAMLAVHFHNDLGLAVANSLAAVSEGADIVQCTVGGFGERAGNAALEEVVLALRLHRDQYGRDTKIDLTHLSDLCRLVFERAGVAPAPTKPVCGANIFATEAGVHQDGVLKNPETYLPYPPELVGHRDGVRVAIGKHSGRRAIRHRLNLLGLCLDDPGVERLLAEIKRLPRPADADADAALADLAAKAGAVVRAAEGVGHA